MTEEARFRTGNRDTRAHPTMGDRPLGGHPTGVGAPADHGKRPPVAADGDHPLVSCIMPTFNRRTFVPEAIRYFLRQDYPNLELVILDDGTDPVSDLVPDHPRIRYERLERRLSIGAKRNLGCEAARGEIIACWDDDDWYAPHRISYQVAPLLAGNADLTVLGETLFYVESEGEFWALTPWLHARMFLQGMIGGTQVFFKKFWGREARYPRVNVTEDVQFITSLSRRGARVLTLANDGVFVYVRHGANSWRFATGRYLGSGSWRQVERPSFLHAADLNPSSRELTAQADAAEPKLPAPAPAPAPGQVLRPCRRLRRASRRAPRRS